VDTPTGRARDRAGGPDDAALVGRAKAGDEGALDDLLVRHYDRVHAICRRLTGDDQDALDATQEALIAVVRGLAAYDGRSRFTTWLYRVTTNACLDQMRRARRRPATSLDHDPAPVGQVQIDQGVADRVSLDEALAHLPVEFRAPVVLRDVLGLDYAEIADVLAIPAGTVRSRIARGRRALALHMADPDDPGPPGNPRSGPDVQAGTP